MLGNDVIVIGGSAGSPAASHRTGSGAANKPCCIRVRRRAYRRQYLGGAHRIDLLLREQPVFQVATAIKARCSAM